MKEGSKWMIYLPPQIAYGEQGSMPTIEPMTTLIFEVELEQVIATK
jgi:FKBP-type peptidyl-prolyl cis-trans isomerase FklB